MNLIRKWISPPHHNNYELAQRTKFLHYTILVIIIGMAMLAVLNQLAGAYTLAGILLFSIFILLGLIFLNARGYYKATGLILVALLYISMVFNLIDGLGLHDPGILAFPAFILIVAYLFEKNATWGAASASILAIILVRVLYQIGYGNFLKHGLDHSTTIAVTICLLYLLVTFIVLIVYTIWEKTLERLNESYDKTLKGWAMTLEYRDLETQGHSNRVVDYMIELAKAFNLTESELEDIKRGALLHDVGKLAIPDKILLKAGPLDADEREVIQKHPLYAKNILEEIPFLVSAINIPYYHHENWDGSGYPAGLKGEEIPLEARMFAIIDNWDALRSDRPYRKAWSKETVSHYIEENSGSKFDPKIAKIFLSLDL